METPYDGVRVVKDIPTGDFRMENKMPAYMAKYPCTNCGDGYLQCAQGLSMNLKCCCGCDHPDRWTHNPPYTKAELLEMWAGGIIPPYVQKIIDSMPD